MNSFKIKSEIEPFLITLPILSVFITNTILYIICQTKLKKDNSLIDSFWGLSFCIPNVLILFLRGSEDINTRMILITTLILIWGIRLSVYIFKRHKKEDYRYKLMRKSWQRKGMGFYYLKSFFIIFMLQSVFSIFINSSALFVNIYSDSHFEGLIWTDYLGCTIWFIGFSIEAIADWQLSNFLKKRKSDQIIKEKENDQIIKGKESDGILKENEMFLKKGLWRYSRHPNYFGESVLWWGVFVMSCSLELGWVTFFSALGITLLIRFVSGVPFPERKYRKNLEWIQYCRETNVFVPWFVSVSKKHLIN